MTDRVFGEGVEDLDIPEETFEDPKDYANMLSIWDLSQMLEKEFDEGISREFIDFACYGEKPEHKDLLLEFFQDRTDMLSKDATRKLKEL